MYRYIFDASIHKLVADDQIVSVFYIGKDDQKIEFQSKSMKIKGLYIFPHRKHNGNLLYSLNP